MACRLVRIALAAGLLGLLTSPAAAQTKVFYRPFGTTWNSYWNWRGGGQPTAGAALQFDLYDGLGYSTTNDLGLVFSGVTFGPIGPSPSAGTFGVSGGLALGGQASTSLTNNSQGAVTIAGAVSLSGGTTVQVNGAGSGSLTLSGVVSETGGAGGLVIDTNPSGTNPLGLTVLGGANTFTGGVGLQSGNLQLNNATALGTGTLSVLGSNSLLLSGATATFANPISLGANTLNVGSLSGTGTYSGLISGTGGVSFRGGAVAFTNAGNTYTGSTRVLGGSVSVAGASGSIAPVFGADTSAIQIGNTSGSGGGRGTSGPFAGAGQANAAELFLNTTGATTFDRGLTVPAGTSPFWAGVYDNGAQSTTFSQPITLAGANSRLGFDPSGSTTPITLNGQVSGPGSLQFTFSGGVLGNTANTYSGGTVLPSGTVTVAAAGSLGTGPVVVSAVTGSAGLTYNGVGTLVVTNPVQLAGGGYQISTTPTITLNTFVLGGTGNITLAQPLLGTTPVNPAAPVVTFGAADNTIGVLTGGTLGNSVVAGTGTLSQYVVNLPGFNVTSTAAPNVSAGSILKYGVNYVQAYTGTVTLSGTGTFGVYGGGANFGSATVGTGRLAAAGQVVVTAAGVNNAAGLTPATLTLNYTTTAAVDRLPDATPVFLHGGELAATTTAATAFTETVGPLTTGGYGILSVTSSNATATLGTLQVGSLNRTAGGTLLARGTSLGANTNARIRFTTAPTGNGSGVLPYVISDTTGVAGTGNTFTTYSTLGGVTPVPLANYSANPASITSALTRYTTTQAGAVTVTAANLDALVIDSSTAAAGTILRGDPAAVLPPGSAGAANTTGILFSSAGLGRISGFQAINFGSLEGIVYAATGPAQLLSPITGTGGLTKGGAGVLFLSADNPGLSGTVAIGGGAVYVTRDAQLGAAANPVLVNGGSLVWATGGAFTRTFSVGDGGGTFNAVAGSSVSLTGVSGNGAFVKAGTGTLTLTGSNPYQGRTAIVAGTLVAADQAVLGAASSPVVFEGTAGGFGSTLRFTGSALSKQLVLLGQGILDTPNATTYSGSLLGGASSNLLNATQNNTNTGLTKIGAGTLSVTTSQPFGGPVAVLEGGLTLGSDGALPGTFGTPYPVTGAPTAASHGTYVANGATLTLDNTVTNLPDRLNDFQGLRLQNGNFVFRGNSAADSTELLNMLLLQSGSVNTVTLVPGAGRNATVGFSTLSQVESLSTVSSSTPAAFVLFRGDGLGQAAGTGTSSTVVFNERATLAYSSVISTSAVNSGGQLVGGGGGPGSTNISILPYAVGDTSSAGAGSSFVTYDGSLSTNVGIRPLTVAEYAPAVGSRANAFTPNTYNLRLNGSTGLAGPTSVNSLNLAGGSVAGPGQLLQVTSGAVLASTGTNTLSVGVVQATSGAFYAWVNDTLTVTSTLAAGPFTSVTVPTYGLVKGGAGTLVLSGPTLLGANTVSIGGAMSVGQGTLRVTDPRAVAPTALIQVLPGGTFDVATSPLTVGGLVGSVLNTVTPNAYNGGTVSLPANGTLGIGWQTGATVFAGSITGSGAGVVRSSPTTTTSVSSLLGTSTYSGPTTVVNGGFQLIGPSAGLPNTSLVNVAGGILTLSQSDINAFGGIAPRVPAAAPFALAGTLNVTGNTNAPTTTTLGQTAAGFAFQGGSTLTVTGGTNSTTALQLGLPASGVLNRVNSATALIRGTNLGTLPLFAGTGNPVVAGTGPNVANLTFVDPTGAGATLAASNFVGASSTPGTTGLRIVPWLVGDISATGTGTAFVTQDAGGLRPLNLSATLGALEAATAFGTATDNVLSNVAAGLPATGSPTANSLTVSGTSVGLTGTGTVTVTSGGVLSTSSAGATAAGVTLAFPTGVEGVVHVTSTNTFTANGPVTGTAGLTKGGSGTLVLGAANPGLAGTVAITNGTLSVASDAALGAAGNSLVFAGPYGSPTLLLSAAVASINRPVLLANGSGTFNVSTGTTTLGSLISGPSAGSGVVGGSLIKSGAGTLVLPDQSNTYGGYGAFTRVDAGTLQFTQDSNLGLAGTEVVFNGGTLQLGGTWTSGRNLFVSAGSTLALNGFNATLSGNIGGISGGTLTIGSASGTPTLTLSGHNTSNVNLSLTANSGVTLVAASNTALGQANPSTGIFAIVNTGTALRLDGSTSGAIYNPVKGIQIAGTGVGGSGALQAVGTASTGGVVTLTAAAQITTPAAGDRLNVYGTLSGNFALTKTGAGTLNLAAPAGNGTVGAVTVSGGTLLVNNQTGTGVANTVTLSASGATLGGNGSVTGLTTVSGAVVSPGNGIGTLTVSGAAAAPTLAAGTVHVMELNSATGAGGTNWDLLRVPNTTASSPLALNASTIRLVTLDGAGNPGLMANFDPNQPYIWDYLHSSGGFSGTAASVTIDSSQFANSTGGGTFAAILSDPFTLSVSFTPVPEPAVTLLAAATALGGVWRLRRRRT